MIKGHVLVMPIGDEKEHKEFMQHVMRLSKEMAAVATEYAKMYKVDPNPILLVASKVLMGACNDFMIKQHEKNNKPSEGAMPSFETTRAEA